MIVFNDPRLTDATAIEQYKEAKQAVLMKLRRHQPAVNKEGGRVIVTIDAVRNNIRATFTGISSALKQRIIADIER
jgi:hypothetical protein